MRTVGTKPLAGFVDDIGYLIDPNQHTAIVRGHIPNPDGLMRAGQFVTATVELLPPKNVVEVPMGALVEDGKDSIVFVQSDPQKPIYTMRRVQVTNRFDRTAYIRSVAVAKRDEVHATGEDGQPSSPAEPLREGERVLTTGGWNSRPRWKTSLPRLPNQIRLRSWSLGLGASNSGCDQILSYGS